MSTATLRPCVEKSRGRDGEDGREVANFINLQAKEGKSSKETREALMKVIGAEMPEFKEEEYGSGRTILTLTLEKKRTRYLAIYSVKV